MIYRRRVNGTTWHFCPTCPRWPRTAFEDQGEVARGSVLCGECKVRRVNGTCDAAAPSSQDPATGGSLSWQEFASAEPELANFGEARFRDGVAFLATIRPDGSPRVHPVSPDLIQGHLLVFMEPTSPKGHDLLRDPRYSLHAFVDPGGAAGEFVCRGTAKNVTGELRRRFGTKAPNALERYVLYELFIKEALHTVYVEKRPIRTRWPANAV